MTFFDIFYKIKGIIEKREEEIALLMRDYQ